MRLLNSKTLQLEAFTDREIPRYAILSHTWGSEEVLFEDIGHKAAELKAGYVKIRFACASAAVDGYSHVWVDTCCIDKSSSAELSEAINSMFRWYRNAAICYTYLEDVVSDSDEAKAREFEQSRWFTRDGHYKN